jgi:putative PIN family toxin of toxin-antitoxin system
VDRVVLDTTVLISSFLRSDGISAQILDLAADAFVLVVAAEILDETGRKLLTGPSIRRRAAYSDSDVQAYLDMLAELGDVVGELPPLRGIVRDPNDDMVVACAVKGEARYIVTRDKDLLSLGAYEGIMIVTPERFRGVLREAGHR